MVYRWLDIKAGSWGSLELSSGIVSGLACSTLLKEDERLRQRQLSIYSRGWQAGKEKAGVRHGKKAAGGRLAPFLAVLMPLCHGAGSLAGLGQQAPRPSTSPLCN